MPTASGVFRDSAVSGLEYQSGGQQGLTGRNGGFVYEVGKTVTFSVGGVVLGTATGKPVLTPVDLVPGGSADTPTVQNIARFLMMLDADGNPENGIVISGEIRSAAAGWPEMDFAAPGFASGLEVVRIACRKADGGEHPVPLPAAAKAHLAKTLSCIEGGVCEGTNIDLALHVLPPIDEPSGGKPFDKTLLDHLLVTICAPAADGSCTAVEEFTGQSGQDDERIRLLGGHYQINWDVDKSEGGKVYEVRFSVAGMEIGFATVAPEAGRTLPIKFRIDNNPQIRAHALHVEGYDAADIGAVLRDEFGLGADTIAQLLKNECATTRQEISQILMDLGFPYRDIAHALKEVYGQTADAVAKLLKDLGATASETATALIASYGSGTDWVQSLAFADYSAVEIGVALRDIGNMSAEEAVASLYQHGFTAVEAAAVLQSAYSITDLAVIEEMLNAAGYLASDILPVTEFPTIAKFAPVLWFDRAASTFPMSAQVYFEEMLCSDPLNYAALGCPKHPVGWGNNDLVSLQTGSVPTYFNIEQCGKQLRIRYWWFYGYQPDADYGCGQEHAADWENIIVLVSEDKTNAAAVVFYQHNGWYTRLRGNAFQLLDGTHPIVYVGKTAHGSYHTGGGEGTCVYYGDFRNPNSSMWPQGALFTWENLVSLAGKMEPWMNADADTNANWTWGFGDVGTHPTKQGPGCSLAACRGNNIILPLWDAGCFYSQCLNDWTDCGTFCTDGGGWGCLDPAGWFTDNTFYNFRLPTTDHGLSWQRN